MSIIYSDNKKQTLVEDYRKKADTAGQNVFDALILAGEWPISGIEANRKTTEEAEASIGKLTARLSFITDRLSKVNAAEISVVLTRFIRLV